jgi:hypothetical protein
MSTVAPTKVNVYGPITRPIRADGQETPSFKSGKPVCPSGAQPRQSFTRVQKPDGTWTTVATGAWTCGPSRANTIVGM